MTSPTTNDDERDLPVDEDGDDTEPTPAIQLVRDPRDTRELLTDILGVTPETSVQEAQGGIRRGGGANLLGQRKRERAWERLQDPTNRLVEEALLYPMEPMPEPEDAEFPTYAPELPPMPRLHETEDALRELLDAVAEAISPPVEPPEPALRADEAPPRPALPDPDFTDE